MNFGGLIALQKQQKKDSKEMDSTHTKIDEKSKSKKNESSDEPGTKSSGEQAKKDKKVKSKKSKLSPEDTAGSYMKDISKINQDIENIKSRSGVGSKIQQSLKFIEEQKPKAGALNALG